MQLCCRRLLLAVLDHIVVLHGELAVLEVVQLRRQLSLERQLQRNVPLGLGGLHNNDVVAERRKDGASDRCDRNAALALVLHDALLLDRRNRVQVLVGENHKARRNLGRAKEA